MIFDEWKDFNLGEWAKEINLRDFIQKNYTPYTGDSSFLAPITKKTEKLWNEVLDLFKKEREAGGVLDISADVASTITSHEAGYIGKNLEEMLFSYVSSLSFFQKNENIHKTKEKIVDILKNDNKNNIKIIEDYSSSTSYYSNN